MTYIDIQKISKSYGDEKILNNISFEIKEGEIVAILGPSGCGKTTLLKCILGLESPDEGRIFIGSHSQTQWLKTKRIAYVPQQHANFNHLTTEQNVSAAINDLVQNKIQKIDRILKSVGLDKYKKNYPGHFSGGMQQRLALARALAQDTDIIAFDESLNSLDIETRQQMQELILELQAEEKKTMIFVTHDIEEALFLADRIIILESKPGIIREILKTPFPFPHKPTLRFDEEFQKIRRILSDKIRSENILKHN